MARAGVRPEGGGELTLPVEQFPHVRRVADDLFGGDSVDVRFEFGLEVSLCEIGTYAQPGDAQDGR